tara:strand:- start:658 stop:879 length:222 start_codon:yes stop_codon:yes gene_type:complete
MDTKLAKKVLPLVNTAKFSELLHEYLAAKISEQHRVLEQSDDTATLHRAQGAITALKKLMHMKDEVQGSAKRD